MHFSGTAPAVTVGMRYAVAAITICITMMAPLLSIPSMLGALSQGYGLEPSALSFLAFGELGGFVLGTYFTSSMSVDELKRWVPGACALAIVSNLTLLLFSPSIPFLVMVPIAGLGAGVGYGYGLKVCAASKKPTRYFGFLTGSTGVMMIVGFQAIALLMPSRETPPELIVTQARHAAKVVFCLYAAFALLAAVLFVFNKPPAVPASNDREARAAKGRLDVSTVLALLAIVLSFIGQGAIYAFLQVLGIAAGYSVTGVANAMSAYAVMSIIGSVCAALLPAGISRPVVIGVTLVLLLSGLVSIYAPSSLIWYMWGCAIGGFYWNFALSIMLGVLARIDHSGRGSVLGGMMSSVGAAIGPLFAGLLIKGDDYRPVGWFVAILCLAGYICMFVVDRANRPVAVGSITRATTP